MTITFSLIDLPCFFFGSQKLLNIFYIYIKKFDQTLWSTQIHIETLTFIADRSLVNKERCLIFKCMNVCERVQLLNKGLALVDGLWLLKCPQIKYLFGKKKNCQ